MTPTLRRLVTGGKEMEGGVGADFFISAGWHTPIAVTNRLNEYMLTTAM